MDLAAVAEHLRALDIEVLTEDLEPYGHDETMDLFAPAGIVVRPAARPRCRRSCGSPRASRSR